MKRLLISLLVFFPLLMGATYKVASDGSGNFSNLTAVNSAVVRGGDFVLFRNSDLFRGRLFPKGGNATAGYVTYGTYGEGAKALLLGSVERNSPAHWVNVGGNIWKNASLAVDVGNIIFNNGGSTGWKERSYANMSQQGDFFYDFVNDSVFVYSITNPASYYNDIELALTQNLIHLNASVSYVKVDGLDLRYTGRHAIGSTGSNNNLVYSNLDISWIGGGDQVGDYSVRLGNGVEIWRMSNNVLVENCTITQVYDAAISNQGATIGNYTQTNITYRNNLITDSEYGYEVFGHTDNVTISNIKVEYNTFRRMGQVWSHLQRWNGVNAKAFSMTSMPAVARCVNNTFMHNVVDNSTQRGIYFKYNSTLDRWKLDYNIYENLKVVAWVADGKSYPNLTAWQATGQDLHSVYGPIDYGNTTGGMALNGVTIYGWR